jgi:hypothetical protein
VVDALGLPLTNQRTKNFFKHNDANKVINEDDNSNWQFPYISPTWSAPAS